MYNISFMTCITQYIGHKSLEDQTLSGQNGCLTSSHSVTQPLDLGLWLSRYSLVIFFFFFLVECNQVNKPCIFGRLYLGPQSYVIFKFSKICNFFIQSMKRKIQSCIYFSYFLLKKISGNSIPLTQKERCPKRYPNLFFKGCFCRGLSHLEKH